MIGLNVFVHAEKLLQKGKSVLPVMKPVMNMIIQFNSFRSVLGKLQSFLVSNADSSQNISILFMVIKFLSCVRGLKMCKLTSYFMFNVSSAAAALNSTGLTVLSCVFQVFFLFFFKFAQCRDCKYCLYFIF